MVNVLFPHLAAVEIEQVDRQDGQILVTARTRAGPVRCPSCGMSTGKMHGYHRRHLADRPVDGLPGGGSTLLYRLDNWIAEVRAGEQHEWR
ncbi:hypothetical protein AB0I81_00820 [Nonomuraea sp. NPDC050404]|uniref:hypothetical protein n=1 Tax=Nonomuraea sp. NPDC050404 TaxID=3155783 RepID=UPI00340964AB